MLNNNSYTAGACASQPRAHRGLLFAFCLLFAAACGDSGERIGGDAGNGGSGGSDGAECGNSNADGTEQCDDGNTVDEDDCTNACQDAACGDGFVWTDGSGAEECDDAGESETCDDDCTIAECGDGVLDPGELCDDGNTSAGDGCDASCSFEPGTAELAICCTITDPIDVGMVDASVEATAIPTTGLVPGESGVVELRGAVDLTGAIPAAIAAMLIDPSNFTLTGVEGTSSSATLDLPTPQSFNTGDDPLLIDVGVHELTVEIDSEATQLCFDLTAATVTAETFGTEVPIPCTPGRCDGASNPPVCLPVSQ